MRHHASKFQLVTHDVLIGVDQPQNMAYHDVVQQEEKVQRVRQNITYREMVLRVRCRNLLIE